MMMMMMMMMMIMMKEKRRKMEATILQKNQEISQVLLLATVAVQSLGADCTDAVRSGHRQKLGFNLDAGAAVTAFPLSLAQEYGLSEPRYKPANGDELADEGGVNLAAQDAHYKTLAIDGRVTDVQEVLCIFGRTGHLSFPSWSALRANPRETKGGYTPLGKTWSHDHLPKNISAEQRNRCIPHDI